MAAPPLVRSDALEALLGLISDSPPAPPQLDDAAWELLAREAVRHGIAPLIYARLGVAGAGSVASASAGADAPQRVVRLLQRYYVGTGMQNLRLYARLSVLLQRLADEAIGVLVLKGAFLGHAVYGNPALRSMGDADLLVRRPDLDAVDRVMRREGWLASATAGRPVTGGHELPGYVMDGVQVEVHWGIEDDEAPFAIDRDGLWERAIELRIGNARALALSAEDLLLHLCLHTAYGHGWLQFDGGLRPFCDVAACLRHYAGRFDWTTFVARAEAWRVRHCAWLTLVLARELLQARVPECVVQQLAPAQADPGLLDIARRLALGRHYAELTEQLPVLGRMWLGKRWRHLPQAARWRLQLLPGSRSLASAYPSLAGTALRPLRYPAHWADLLLDALRLSFRSEPRLLLARERQRLALLGWLESSAP